MRVCITGGSGFIGKHLIDRLSPVIPIVLLSRSCPSKLPVNVTCLQLDLESDLTSQLTDIPYCDFLIHCATSRNHRLGVDSLDELLTTNTTSPLKLVRHMASMGSSIINMSTSSVYGDMSPSLQISEDSQSIYSVSKVAFDLIGSIIAKHYNVVFNTLRLVAPYGKGLTNRLLADIPNRIKNNIPVHLPLTSEGLVFNPIHIDHILNLIEYLLFESNTSSSIFQCGGDRSYTLQQYALECSSLLDKTVNFVRTTSSKDLDLRVSPLRQDLAHKGLLFSLPEVPSPADCLCLR